MMDGMIGHFMADFSRENKMEMMFQMMPRMMVTMMPKMISEVKDIIEGKDIDFKEFMAGAMEKVVPVIMEGINKDAVVEHKEEIMSVLMKKDCICHHIPQIQCRMMPG